MDLTWDQIPTAVLIGIQNVSPYSAIFVNKSCFKYQALLVDRSRRFHYCLLEAVTDYLNATRKHLLSQSTDFFAFFKDGRRLLRPVRVVKCPAFPTGPKQLETLRAVQKLAFRQVLQWITHS